MDTPNVRNAATPPTQAGRKTPPPKPVEAEVAAEPQDQADIGQQGPSAADIARSGDGTHQSRVHLSPERRALWAEIDRMQAGSGNPEELRAKLEAAGPQYVNEFYGRETTTTELGARITVPSKIFEGPPDETGVQTTTHTIGLIPYENMDEALAAGVILPDIDQVNSKAGLGPRGRLEVMTLPDTNNPKTVAIAVPMEIPADSQHIDPATGKAPIEDMEARLVPRDAEIVPKFHHAELSDSDASRKIELGVNMVEKVSEFAGNITQSSLAGIMWEFQAAPVVAFATAPIVGVKSARDWVNVAKRMSYVENLASTSSTDTIQMYQNGLMIPVSAKEETKRLANQAMAAKTKLASAAFLGAAGTIGTLGLFKAGVLGSTVTSAVAAATPFVPALATAGMVSAGASAGINAGKELIALGREKKELLELQAQLRAEGKPEVIRRTVEQVHRDLKRPVAVNEVDMPIEKRLDEISAAQKKNVAMASFSAGLSGATVASVGLGLLGFGTAMGVGVAPTAVITGFNSARDLINLGKEKKELQAQLAEKGEGATTREVRQMQDGTWKEVEIPIEQRLEELQRSINGKKVILTASGSGLAALGATLAAGVSGWIAFPAAALVVGGVAAVLFPEEAKALAQGAWKLIAGRFSKDARSERATKGQVKDDVKQFRKQVKDLEVRMKEADPTAYKLLTAALGQYAQNTNAQGRQESVKNIAEALDIIGQKEAQPAKEWLDNFRTLDGKVTDAWKEHEIGVHLRSEDVKKTLANSSLPDRLQERGADPDNMAAAYEELFRAQSDPQAMQDLQNQAQAGDKAAQAKLELMGIFAAAAVITSLTDELGEEWTGEVKQAVTDLNQSGQKVSLEGFKAIHQSAEKTAGGGSSGPGGGGGSQFHRSARRLRRPGRRRCRARGSDG